MVRLNTTPLFFRNFLKNPARNASVIPSSERACKAILRGIDFSKVNTIVELGPGDGPITAQILKKCKRNTKLILIELEESYIDVLRKRFGKRVIIENVCATRLPAILKKHKLTRVDVIISGLPFLPPRKMKKLLTAVKKHTDNGTIFRFFTYIPPVMKKVYAPLPVKKKGFVWRNVPPFWAYGIN